MVATLPFNLGVGGAMQVGFKYAREQGFDNVVQVDSDGQHDPASVPSLLEALEGADLVLGARFAGEGDYSARGLRRLAMVVLAAILSRIAHTKLTDVTSGNKASGPRAIALFADHYPAEYLGDTIESLVIARPFRHGRHPGAGLDARTRRRRALAQLLQVHGVSRPRGHRPRVRAHSSAVELRD